MFLSDITAVFLLGLAGSGHCIGMCGGFALAVSRGASGWRQHLLRHFAYQLGKATSYAFIGVLLLLVTAWLSTEVPVQRLQAVIGLIAGIVMIVAGLLMLLERRLPAVLERWWKGSALCGAVGALWNSPSLSRNVLLGWINGFLPCGLSLIALLYLCRNQSVATTLVGSVTFTAGTFLPLLAIGMLGAAVGSRARRWWVRIAGVLLILFGVLTLLRDHPAVHHWFHNLILDTPVFDSGDLHQHHH